METPSNPTRMLHPSFQQHNQSTDLPTGSASNQEGYYYYAEGFVASSGDLPNVTTITPLTRPTEINDPYDFVYNGVPTSHRQLRERSPCPHCHAKRFQFECPSFCCMIGKTMLAFPNIPPELLELYTAQTNIGHTYRNNIRAYNTSFSFASMGVSLDETVNNMTTGVYTFRAHKTIYHRVDQLVPRDRTPRYLQLYFYDPSDELEHRLQWPNLDATITEIISRTLSANPYAITFRHLSELGPLDSYRVTLNAETSVDQRCYSRPTTSDVADPATNNSRKTVAMREYYCYKFQICPTENLILLGGRLLQQYALDMYIKIETSKLQYYALNQNL
ncbi:uncharacterized protein LOC143602492 [Bidens hawaiensis]|uniref:uncharacterized protein LOC143602492 n=1 Tax=Bidens hawaiensis TaxID=980011 RepID=UPI00404B708B